MSWCREYLLFFTGYIHQTTLIQVQGGYCLVFHAGDNRSLKIEPETIAEGYFQVSSGILLAFFVVQADLDVSS